MSENTKVTKGRRAFLKKVAYVAPVVATSHVMPSYATNASGPRPKYEAKRYDTKRKLAKAKIQKLRKVKTKARKIKAKVKNKQTRSKSTKRRG